MKRIHLVFLLIFSVSAATAQPGWKLCTAPVFNSRVDDLFMVDHQTGYAVCGDGKIVKTVNGGERWIIIEQTSNVYNRSVEFINAEKGFVGGFPVNNNTGTNILRRTTDGGATWTDLSPLLDVRARKGICGLAVADANTIYGGGNWYQNAGYIVKSVDGGNSWSFIDMSAYASSIIDMYFINKDVGFVTGRGPSPLQTGIILYTTDGGATWTYKFQNTQPNEYCWKIQRLTPKIFFASLEDFGNVSPSILKSTDGGMTWNKIRVRITPYNIEGIGFIDENKGWTGGDGNHSFESNDGGATWQRLDVCPYMNRVFKVNDTLLFASGDKIYRYNTGGFLPAIPASHYVSLACSPNPANNNVAVSISLAAATHAMLGIYDNSGRLVAMLANADKAKGSYLYRYNTSSLQPGIYYVVLKTHEDKVMKKITVLH